MVFFERSPIMEVLTIHISVAVLDESAIMAAISSMVHL